MKRLFKYLKAAFFVREKIPLLGDVPINLMAVIGFIALGFGHPAFWLIGLLGETIFLWLTSGSSRFQNLVDAIDSHADTEASNSKRSELVEKLNTEHKPRYKRLVEQFDLVKDYYEQFEKDEHTSSGNLANLSTLESVYLRLLIAHQHLTSPHRKADVEKIRQHMAKLESGLKETTSDTIAESRSATLELLRKRLGVFEKRKQAIEEIDADLDQIETQFQLAADSATIRAKPEDTKLDMDLARIMMSPDYISLGADTSPDIVSFGAALEGQD